jgi:hydrogenase assembly chaperone HypC/HupF
MCLMAPAEVIRVDGTSCDVELAGRIERVSTLLEPDVEAGDMVLVLGGTVVRLLDRDQAIEMRRALALIDEPVGSEPTPA